LLSADAYTYVVQCLKSSLVVFTALFNSPHQAARQYPEMRKQQTHIQVGINGQTKSTIKLG